VVITKCSAPGQLALAYDDGPYQYTQKLSDILKNGGAKGTFFVTGTLYGKNPMRHSHGHHSHVRRLGCIYNQRTALKSAYDAGHQIASHTWSHPQNFGSMSTSDLTSQMSRLETALANILGVKPTYMRPPYLATGGNVLSVMKTMGYRVITDDVDAEDWNGKTPAQSQQKFQQAGAGGNGHIPLMHETYQGTVETLTPWLINWAKSNNLKLVTVGEFVVRYLSWRLWANGLQRSVWAILGVLMLMLRGMALPRAKCACLERHGGLLRRSICCSARLFQPPTLSHRHLLPIATFWALDSRLNMLCRSGVRTRCHLCRQSNTRRVYCR
jgi:peptidoglycan/xylan/chitin deacetylase (PgdA/CDA1 family)